MRIIVVGERLWGLRRHDIGIEGAGVMSGASERLQRLPESGCGFLSQPRIAGFWPMVRSHQCMG